MHQGTDTTGAGLASRLLWLQECGFGLRAEDVAQIVCAAGDEAEALSLLLGAQPSVEEVSVWARAAVQHHRTACLEELLQRGGLAVGLVHLEHLLTLAADTHFGQQLKPGTAMWLVEQLTGEGVPEAQRHCLTANVFAAAARFGHLPLLQLLRQRGCPWDETAWEGAAKGGCVAVLEWLHEAGCPKPVRLLN